MLPSTLANAFMGMENPTATSGVNRLGKFIEGTPIICRKPENKSII